MIPRWQLEPCISGAVAGGTTHARYYLRAATFVVGGPATRHSGVAFIRRCTYESTVYRVVVPISWINRFAAINHRRRRSAN